MARMSAFAARKVSANVVQSDSTSSDSVIETTNTTLNLQNNENDHAVSSRPKKRRRSDETLTISRKKAGSEDQESRLSKTAACMQPKNDIPFPKDSPLMNNEAQLSTDSNSNVEAFAASAGTVRQLCTFDPSRENILAETNTCWTVSLGGEDSLALIGQYDLWIRKGAVSIYGAILHASSKLHRVYAPATHAIPVIKAVINPYSPYGRSAEIKIVSCKSRIRLLNEISSEYGKIWNESIEEARSPIDTTRRSFTLIPTSTDDAHRRPLYNLSLSADSQLLIRGLAACDTDKERPVILVCGPKGSGKSTFCRTLINAILTQSKGEPQSSSLDLLKKSTVALLDIDPGQPEYALPGEIALVEVQHCILGPPFTHPEIDQSNGSRIVQLQCYGNLSPKEDPAHYLDCVLTIYDSYRNLMNLRGNLPTIINCSGWTQGGGLELLVQLIQRLYVSNVVYMSDGGGPEDVMGTLAKLCSNKSTRLHPLSSTPMHAMTRTAAELRMMQTLSYFHLAEPEAGELRWNYKALQEMAPTVIHYSGPKQCILAVMILGDEQDPKSFETILDGCLVEIVVIDNESALPEVETAIVEEASQNPDDHEDTPDHLYHPSILRSPTFIPYIPAKDHTVRPLPPKYTHSIGQALIRSINTQNHEFHLLMPLHFVMPRIRQNLKQKIVLVRGKLDTPIWAYREPLQLDRARRRRREEHSGIKEGKDEDELEDFAKEKPWASVAGGKRSAGEKKRSGRRDLKYRSQAEGE